MQGIQWMNKSWLCVKFDFSCINWIQYEFEKLFKFYVTKFNNLVWFSVSYNWAVSSPYSSKMNSVLDKIGLDNLILIMIVLSCKALTRFEIQFQFGSFWWKQDVHRILVKLNFFLSFKLNIFGSSEGTNFNICYFTLKVSARLLIVRLCLRIQI